MLILFTSPYRSFTDNLSEMNKITPGNSGIWKTLKGTDDINNFDYIIILDNIDKHLEKLGKDNFMKLINNDYNKIIHFQREHINILKFEKKTWYNTDIFPKLKNKFMANDYKFTFKFPSFINKTYDELKNLKYPEKNKLLSSIVSYKKGTIYVKKVGADYLKRINLLTKYSKSHPNKIDIFGKGWPKDKLGSNYKGELGSYHKNNVTNTSKYDGLIDYDYSIALVNFSEEKLFNEKITDCILCWAMPIYSGHKDVKKCFPEDSYYLINLDDKNVISKIDKFVESKPTEDNIKALAEARELILDKYNIWEQIYQVITNYDNFVKEYSLK